MKRLKYGDHEIRPLMTYWDLKKGDTLLIDLVPSEKPLKEATLERLKKPLPPVRVTLTVIDFNDVLEYGSEGGFEPPSQSRKIKFLVAGGWSSDTEIVNGLFSFRSRLISNHFILREINYDPLTVFSRWIVTVLRKGEIIHRSLPTM